jgi:aryl-alcohol dehydrogenase-like predicted oxidoreductase
MEAFFVSLRPRPLGSTGLSVSALGFGGAVIGIDGYLVDDDRDDPQFLTRAATAVRTAVEQGITMFDTAPGYGAGRSESLMGQALEPYRDRITLATKVGVRPDQDPQGWTESLLASLDRLRTRQVDLLQLHGGSWTDELAEWALGAPADWLAQMRGRGLTRAVGFTAEVPSGGVERMLRSGRFQTLQMAYSLIYQGACDYQREPFGPIPLAKSLGMGVLTMRTTTSGVLPRLLADFPRLSSADISRLAIKFVLSTPEVDCALVGMSNPEEVRANCALAADENDRFDLEFIHNRIHSRPR